MRLMGPLDSQPNELGRPVLQVGIEDKDLVCEWVDFMTAFVACSNNLLEI